MEHEDNAQLDNILQGSQHLIGNLQMASGESTCANVVDEIGGKFDEHGVHDEEEWKYIKEGQQSEKQHQQVNADVDCKDMEGIEEVGNGYGYDYGYGNVGVDSMLKVDQHEVDNGVVTISVAADAHFVSSATGNEEIEDILKNDGDFSTTSNTTSTNGEDIGRDVLQVEMKIELPPLNQLLAHHSEDLSIKGLTEDDDPSSLATNTTNGTNSLSENVPQQQIEQIQLGGNLIEDFSTEDKENSDPLLIYDGCSINNETPDRPNELDIEEMHSQLNPNAIEFVPSFGSNPTSPLAPTCDAPKFVVQEPTFNHDADENKQPQPTAIPHHLLGDDDFVAQSPRKGSGESNFDGIAIPDQIIDFEHEASKRPHELEQEDDLIVVSTTQNPEQEQQLNFEIYDKQIEENESTMKEDFRVYRHQSPSSLIDHGPETCVDLEADIDMQTMETNKKVSQQGELPQTVITDSVVDMLNTVQPLPLDDEEILPQESVAGKELLDVEEKENISNSPSTEEMQVNVQNELHSSAKDIPQIPIDMDNAAYMQESFYMKNTSSEMRNNIEQMTGKEFENSDMGIDEPNVITDHGLDEISFETMRAAEPNTVQTEFEERLGENALFNSKYMPAQKEIGSDVVTPSPISTEEKHLVEDTKEQTPKPEYELEQKMDSLKISTKDEILSQVEEVAQTAANIIECMNTCSAPEPEQHETVEQMPIEAHHSFSTESQPHADLLQQNHEQFYHNEQKEQHQTTQEMESEAVYGHHENDLFLAHPIEQSTSSPTKLEFELSGFDNGAPATFSMEDKNLASVTAHNVFASTTEPSSEATSVPQQELIAPTEQQLVLTDPESSNQQELMHMQETGPNNVFEASSDIFSDLSTGNEALLVISGAPVSLHTDSTLAPVIDTTESAMSKDFITAAAGIGAIAATAAAGTVAAKSDKKPDIKKASTPTSTKAKAHDGKKGAEPIKKPIGTSSKISVSSAASAARPHTGPAKATTITEKKPSTFTSTVHKSSTSAATATRKPLTSAASSTKTTTARPTTAPAAPKPAAARTANTATTARRSAPTTTSGSTANGIAPTTKPKTLGVAPTKPTTLGLTTTTKPKLSSPRNTLTSQLRKTAPTTNTGTCLTTARSPLKTTASTTNGISKILANTTAAASRAKSSTSTTTITTTTKTFTARPAPKTTHSATLSSTTTRRTTGGVSTSISTTGTKTTTTSTLQKKTSPGTNTRLTAAPGKSSLSPNKTSSAALKLKTKDVLKKAITPTKTTNETKAKPIKRPPQINGTDDGAKGDLGNQSAENKAQLNDRPIELIENGAHHTVLKNGEGSLLEQQNVQEPALIDA
ncbi:205 kDa microtubule-associated protein [Eurosta solidaginis]|uniref:205 kDa microtubule-associated protein n=1 Tax=Eurosta solidaginis TaxID=178769 RepID=UPI0035311DC7